MTAPKKRDPKSKCCNAALLQKRNAGQTGWSRPVCCRCGNLCDASGRVMECGAHDYATADEADAYAAYRVNAALEEIAAWMMKHGFATGHGESISDLLEELDWQIKDRVNASLEEAAQLLDSDPSGDRQIDTFCQWKAKQIRARKVEVTP